MKYRLICLQRPLIIMENDDVELDFVMVDDNDDIINDLTGWTFKGEIEGTADEILLTNSYFATSGAKITLTIPNADTDLNDGDHDFEIQGTKDSKDYTLFTEVVDISEEIVNW